MDVFSDRIKTAKLAGWVSFLPSTKPRNGPFFACRCDFLHPVLLKGEWEWSAECPLACCVTSSAHHDHSHARVPPRELEHAPGCLRPNTVCFIRTRCASSEHCVLHPNTVCFKPTATEALPASGSGSLRLSPSSLLPQPEPSLVCPLKPLLCPPLLVAPGPPVAPPPSHVLLL